MQNSNVVQHLPGTVFGNFVFRDGITRSAVILAFGLLIWVICLNQVTWSAESARLTERQLIVSNDTQLRLALRQARPGITIRIQGGQYPGELWIENLHGRPDAPIVIEAADPQNPPVFVGGQTGLQIARGSYFTLRYLRFRGQKVNG